jgi:hypothetical protein
MAIDTSAGRRPRSAVPAVLLAVGGVVLIGVSLVIGSSRYGPHGQLSLSQMNGLCASTFGQFAQAANSTASSNCSSVATTEQARGWLLVAGIITIVAGAAWAAWRVSRQPPAPNVPFPQ